MKNYKTAFSNIVRSLSILALAMFISSALSASAKAQPSEDNGLIQVDTKYVCMINNHKFEKEQIAVDVEGQTYYGCCEMCKEKLKKDAKSRMAVDPVSGKKVDKAKAVIGAASDGTVFYFENVENMKKYKPESATGKQDEKHSGSHQ